jgi:hypothetical protein
VKAVKPTFFIIGAAKSGTTSLAQQLSEQAGIFIPARKEMMFFNRSAVIPAAVAQYEKAFETEKEVDLSGEASPQYSFGSTFPYTASRIAEYCPHAKIIYVVRDPVVRMQSHILQIRNWGGIGDRSVQDTIAAYPQVLEASMYASRIQDYLRAFPMNQLMIIPFESLIAEGGLWLGRVAEFLGVSVRRAEGLVRKNISAHHFEDRGVMRLLRRFGLGEVGRFLPQGAKSRFIHLFKKRQTGPPPIPAKDADVLEQLFREEVKPLMDEWNVDIGAWSFRPQAEPFSNVVPKEYEGRIRLS